MKSPSEFSLNPIIGDDLQRIFLCFNDFLVADFELLIQRWHYTGNLPSLDLFFDAFKLAPNIRTFFFSQAAAIVYRQKFYDSMDNWRLWELREEYFFQATQPFGIRDLFRRGYGEFNGYADHYLDDIPENYDLHVTPKVNDLLSILIPNWQTKDLIHYFGGTECENMVRTPALMNLIGEKQTISLHLPGSEPEYIHTKIIRGAPVLFKEVPSLLINQNNRDRSDILNYESAKAWHHNLDRTLAQASFASDWLFGSTYDSFEDTFFGGNNSIQLVHNKTDKELVMLIVN